MNNTLKTGLWTQMSYAVQAAKDAYTISGSPHQLKELLREFETKNPGYPQSAYEKRVLRLGANQIRAILNKNDS